MLESQRKGVEYLGMLQGQGYEYQLVNYTSNLSEITFQAYKAGSPGQFLRITFQTTLYIQTVVHWEQGDFRLATAEEFQRLADAMNLSDIQREQMLLFIACPPDKPDILILCHQVFVSRETPWP